MTGRGHHHFAFLDEGSKRVLRRAMLKAVSIPGYQVPFASREMPIARGWGTGGLQLTLSLIGREDIVKVIDQGADDSVNAVSIKNLILKTTDGVSVTEDAREATVIQSRHRIPEDRLAAHQILVLQVPKPEPLRSYEPSEQKTKVLHAEKDYSGAYLGIFEEIVRHGTMTSGASHPVMVNDRYIMTPSPIPKWDNPKMHQSEALILLGAGREKKIHAVPPYTTVQSLEFEDVPFEIESFDEPCVHCGATGVFMDQLFDVQTGRPYYQCNDTGLCKRRRRQREVCNGSR